MRRNLHEIFGGVGVRSAKKGDQRLVDAWGRAVGGVLPGLLVEYIGQPRPRVFERLAQTHQLPGNRGGLGAAQPHNPYAPAARRRGNGGDGVGIHAGYCL